MDLKVKRTSTVAQNSLRTINSLAPRNKNLSQNSRTIKKGAGARAVDDNVTAAAWSSCPYRRYSYGSIPASAVVLVAAIGTSYSSTSSQYVRFHASRWKLMIIFRPRRARQARVGHFVRNPAGSIYFVVKTKGNTRVGAIRKGEENVMTELRHHVCDFQMLYRQVRIRRKCDDGITSSRMRFSDVVPVD